MTPCPIVTALQAGQQPWHTHHGPRPVTAAGLPFPGAASVLLWLQGRSSPVWLSAAMVERLGGSVTPAEAPTAIPEGKVYCAEQITGVSLPALPRSINAARFMAATGASILGSEQPCYNTAFDFIGTPRPHLYGEIAHELLRWTARRVGRDLPMTTERMVCEIGASLLCADWGLTPLPRRDQAAFVPTWAQWIDQKPRLFIDAANAAGRAVEYLHGLQPKAAADLGADWQLAA